MTASVAGKAIVDTNILFYVYDEDAGEKRSKSMALVRQLMSGRNLVLSAQILNEFYVTATRPNRMTPQRAGRIVHEFIATCDILPLRDTTTTLALRCVARHGMSYWDALIWAAAKENGIPLVYTEDFQHGRDLEGVRIENPLLGTAAP